MQTFLFVLAFFRAAPPVTRPIVSCLWLSAAAGCAAMAAGLAPAETVLTPLLVLQIFAASSGFGLAARRGYYDLVLCRGVSLTRLLGAHWLASMAPGVAAWLVVALVERLVSPPPSATLSSGSVLALALASTIPWAVTTTLPRFAAAIGWLVLLVTSLAVVPSGQIDLVRAARAPWPSPLGALAVVVYPMSLLGVNARRLPAGTLAPGIGCAMLSVGAALWWHRRGEVPLESGG